MQVRERAIYTLSVPRPQLHNTSIETERREMGKTVDKIKEIEQLRPIKKLRPCSRNPPVPPLGVSIDFSAARSRCTALKSSSDRLQCCTPKGRNQSCPQACRKERLLKRYELSFATRTSSGTSVIRRSSVLPREWVGPTTN